METNQELISGEEYQAFLQWKAQKEVKKAKVAKKVSEIKRTLEWWVQRYLGHYHKAGTIRYSGNALNQFFAHCPTHPADLGYLEFEEIWAAHFGNNPNLCESTKEKYYECVNGFFTYMTYYFNRECEEKRIPRRYWFLNPIPPLDYLPKGASKRTEKVEKCFSIEQVYWIVETARATKPEYLYLMIFLQCETGLRRSEVVTIQLRKINWETGEIITGLEEEGEKTGEQSVFIKGRLYYELKAYVANLTKKHPDCIYLFPQMHQDRIYNDQVHVSVHPLTAFFQETIQNAIPKAQNHWFRHSLITHRIKKFGIELWKSEWLQGHSISATQVKAYLHLDRHDEWLKNHPYDFG